MPIPLSATAISAPSPAPRPLTVTCGATSGAVYLIALPSRLRKTRCSWPASARSTGSSPTSTVEPRSAPAVPRSRSAPATLAGAAARGGGASGAGAAARLELVGLDGLEAQVGRPGARVEQQV